MGIASLTLLSLVSSSRMVFTVLVLVILLAGHGGVRADQGDDGHQDTAVDHTGRASGHWNVDRERVKNGILENKNIMTHIGKNLFFFVFSTVAWITISQVLSLTASTMPRNQVAGE